MRTFLSIEIFVMDACVLIDYLLGLSGFLLELNNKKKKKKLNNSHLTNMIIVRLFPTIMVTLLPFLF